MSQEFEMLAVNYYRILIIDFYDMKSIIWFDFVDYKINFIYVRSD